VSFQGFDLPDDLKMLSDTIAEFVRKEIVPVEASVPGDSRDPRRRPCRAAEEGARRRVLVPAGAAGIRRRRAEHLREHRRDGADGQAPLQLRTAGRGGRHLTWEAAWDADQGRDARTKASIAKLYGTETGFAVVDAMMQILGGMGMTKDMPLEHWFRGLRVARVVEGPSEIHRFLIARDMLGGAALGRGA
jgi:hypothetical protein